MRILCAKMASSPTYRVSCENRGWRNWTTNCVRMLLPAHLAVRWTVNEVYKHTDFETSLSSFGDLPSSIHYCVISGQQKESSICFLGYYNIYVQNPKLDMKYGIENKVRQNNSHAIALLQSSEFSRSEPQANGPPKDRSQWSKRRYRPM